MSLLAGIILGMLLAILAVLAFVLSIALFAEAFRNPQFGGGHAIAGSVLVGSSMITLAIASRRGPEFRD